MENKSYLKQDFQEAQENLVRLANQLAFQNGCVFRVLAPDNDGGVLGLARTHGEPRYIYARMDLQPMGQGTKKTVADNEYIERINTLMHEERHFQQFEIAKNKTQPRSFDFALSIMATDYNPEYYDTSNNYWETAIEVDANEYSLRDTYSFLCEFSDVSQRNIDKAFLNFVNDKCKSQTFFLTAYGRGHYESIQEIFEDLDTYYDKWMNSPARVYAPQNLGFGIGQDENHPIPDTVVQMANIFNNYEKGLGGEMLRQMRYEGTSHQKAFKLAVLTKARYPDSIKIFQNTLKGQPLTLTRAFGEKFKDITITYDDGIQIKRIGDNRDNREINTGLQQRNNMDEISL